MGVGPRARKQGVKSREGLPKSFAVSAGRSNGRCLGGRGTTAGGERDGVGCIVCGGREEERVRMRWRLCASPHTK